MTALRPSDCHPDLTDARLTALATFLASTRLDVVMLHEPSAGDDSWSLGCRAFARTRNLISTKALAGDWPWLTVINPGKRFIFAIGAVPIRFYRGFHTDPPARTLAFSPIELNQLSLAFDDSQVYRALKWRFAIETDFLGLPSSIMFAGLSGDDGSVVHSWPIAFDQLTNVQAQPPRVDDVIELPAPVVGVRPDTTLQDQKDSA